MKKNATINRKTTIHRGRVFDVMGENVTLPNGVTIDLEVVRHPGASAVVPLTRQKSVIMIKQYRHAVGGYIWEIPAGTLDPNESPLECAKREVIEETGFSASRWKKLGEITPVPGYSDERIHLYLAMELEAAEQALDRDEVLQVHQIPFQEALQMIFRGEIQDAKTITGLLLAERALAIEDR